MLDKNAKIDDELFSMYVSAYLKNNDLPKLADHFETALSTITRWAAGIACPHPAMAVDVIDYIKNNSTLTDFQKLVLFLLEQSSIEQAAEFCGVSHPTIKKWAVGDSEPHEAVKDKLVSLINQKLEGK